MTIENIGSGKIYIVGNKIFGNSNGVIYNKRQTMGYYDQTVKLPDEFIRLNAEMKNTYGDHYIDMITPLLNSDNEIKVFTDDKHYISQDCRHLTKYGAQYYSRVLENTLIGIIPQ